MMGSMHRAPLRTPAGFLLLSLVLGLFGGPPAASPAAAAAPGPLEGFVDWMADDGECRCKAGNACWHYLRAPAEPPADACWCNFCVKVSKHDGSRAMPEGWNEICCSNGKMDCFLKRHALSWNMVCSDCPKNVKCCNTLNPEACPNCGKVGPPALSERQKELEFRLKRESDLFASRDVVIVWSTHFYVVTDIPTLKIRTQGGSYRVVGTHELAHIYAERAEKAYREFIQNFGDAVQLDKPAGIFLPKRESTAGRIQAQYFSSPRTNLLYGGSSDGRVADGFCFNGFCASLGKHGGDDVGLHHVVRHMLGHLLVSCWTKVDGKDRVLPRWMFEGVAHWLGKRHPLLKDEVVWCADEGSPISGSGKDWQNDARKIAGDPKTVPVERLLEKSTIGLLDFDDHVRSWSWFELCLAEDREPFVAVLTAMRNEIPARQAWMDAMHCTPAEWDQRWKDRVLGRRPSMGATLADKGDDDGPGAAERRSIRNEMDMQNLVAKIRSIGVCADPRTAKVLVEQFGRESEAVREVLTVVLSKTTEPKALAAMREYGLTAAHPMVRAYTARVLGLAGDAASVDAIRLLVEDPFWLARAEAALALMRAKDPKLADSVKPLLSDSAAKVRIAAMDAAASAGSAAEKVQSLVAVNLSHSAWQVRSAAAESLGGIGAMTSVEALIDRMTTEAGRVRRDCYEALKKVTGDDLTMNPEHWAKWWKKERERAGGGLPAKGEAPPDTSIDEQRYGLQKPPVYGLRVFSDRVGYVLDMSNSMFNLFEPDPEAVKKLRRSYKGANKFDISREEIVQSVQGLDPRARFTVMVFSNRPRYMSKELVPATPDNHRKAESFLRSCRSSPDAGGGASQMTSFYDAFRAIFDLPDGATPPANFTETPDTMFFLTDGAPTLGEIIDADELLAWFTGLNRYARIRVHVVAYGNLGIDTRFLSGLAEQNGGVYINIGEAKAGSSPPPPPPPPQKKKPDHQI